MEPEMQVERLVDGFVLVTDDWSLLENEATSFYKHLFLQKADDRVYKGVLRLHKKKGVQIVLEGNGIVDNIVKAILITWDEDDVAEEYSRQDIKRLFYQGIDHALEQLPPGGRTRRDYYEGNSCHTFEQQSRGEKCSRCRGRFVLHGSEAEKFGDELQAFLRENLREGYECCLIVYKIGQSKSFTAVAKNLENFNLSVCDEFILHVAEDYWIPGKCVLWNTEKVEGLASQGRRRRIKGPKEVYNTLFMGKHASFEFDRTKCGDDYQHLVSRAPAGVVHYAHVKFYIDPYKEIHRGRDDRFKRPIVEEIFTHVDGRYHDGKTAEVLMSWIKPIRAGRELLEKTGHNVARFEVVCNLSGPNLGFRNGDVKPKDVLDKFEIFVDNQFHPRNNIRNCLSVYPFQELLRQIDDTIILAVDTLENLIIELQRKRELPGIDSIPSTKDVILAVACEVVIGFGIYGKINHFIGGRRFNTGWKDALNLKPNAFKESQHVFPGLGNSRRLRVHRIENTNFRVLEYDGPANLTKSFYDYIAGDADDMTVRELQEHLIAIYEARNNVEDFNYEERLQSIADIYLTHFVDKMVYAMNKGPIRPHLDLSPAQIRDFFTNTADYRPVTFENSHEFVSRYFTSDDHPKERAMAYMAKEINKLLPDGPRRRFRILLAEKMDVFIFKTKSLALVYNWGGQKFSCILPLIGDLDDWLDEASAIAYYQDPVIKRDHILAHHKFAYHHRWDIEVPAHCFQRVMMWYKRNRKTVDHVFCGTNMFYDTAYEYARQENFYGNFD